MLLDGKTAVITGGTTGLGIAIAERFLQAGAHVVCAARNRREIGLLESAYGDSVLFQPVDVTDNSSVLDLFSETEKYFGVADVVVANAGISRDGRLLDLPPRDLEDVLHVNVLGVLNTIRAAAPAMLQRGEGRIITISSIMGSRPAQGAGAYCASKAAVEMLTRTLALELGRSGVLVNSLAPGFIDAGMGTRLTSNEQAWPRYSKSLALGRSGRGEEVADAALFLASSQSSYVNGHVLEVSGSLRAW